ncbi:hypothetical protein [Streptomyces mayteni]
MTSAPMATTALYEGLGALYEYELARHGIQTAMLTHKWQRSDLLAPHSDLDVRILLDQHPDDWLEWCQRLAAAHRAAVSRSAINRRLLEHPPGFTFTVSEVHRRRVSPPELATWTLIHGHTPTLQRWKSHAQMIPWRHQDERFYRAILNARLGGRYRLSADSTDNVLADLHGYRRHCVAWHYLAPCWFAAAALATHTRCPGKSAALTQWRPTGTERYADFFLRQAVNSDTPASTAQDLLRTADAALKAALRHVPPPSDLGESDVSEDARATAWTMTAGMLRVRVARWLYYLEPPPGAATGYLIAREAKELRSAAHTLRSLAADETTHDQRLAARMADLVPTGPTTPTVLRDVLADWQRDHVLVEDFFTHHAV